MRRAAKITLSILLVVGTAWLVLRLYLHSSGVAKQVTDQLTALYGGPVRIESVDIGLTSTTINGLQFFEEPGQGSSETPWLKVQSATADIPLWRLIRGAVAATHVNVQGAEVLLRFDDAGELLTRFPEKARFDKQVLPWDQIPQMIAIERSQVTVRQNGRGDSSATNINARVAKEAGNVVLAGTVDSDIGKLKLSGSLAENSLLATARVSTQATAHVTQDVLDRLPLVPMAVLGEFRIGAGDADGALTVIYDLRDKTFHYRADLAARNTQLYLPSVAVAVRNGSGKITIDDNLVHVRTAKGHALGGAVYAEGDLDFRGAGMRMTFAELKAENLDVKNVPAGWGIPAAVRKSIADGKLFGKATLDMTLVDAGAIAAAAATLVARAAPDSAAAPWPAHAALIAASPHEPMHIESRGKGEVRDPAGKKEPIEFDWRLAPVHVPEPEANSTLMPGNLGGMLTTLIAFEAQPKPQTPPNYVELKFNLNNASLAEIVKNEDLKLPFPIDGKISLQVKASIPVDRLADLKAYKAEGSAQVRQLALAGVKLDEVTTDFHFGDGMLYFTSLKSALADNAGKDAMAGTLSGSARVQLAPLGDLHADLKFEKIPVNRLADQPPEQVQGTISGTFAIRGNMEKLKSAKDLEADGALSSKRLTIYGFTLDQIVASVKLKNGVASFPDLQARVEGELLKPTASLQLNDDQSFLARVELRDWDTGAIRKIAATKQIAMPPVSGAVSAVAIVKGSLQPFQVAISGDVQAPSLKLDALETQDVRVHWEYAENKLKATDVNACAYDGKVTGSGLLPMDGKSPGTLDLQVQDLNVKRLAKDLRMPIAMEGRVRGTLNGTLPAGVKGQTGKAEFHVDFKAPTLRVQNIPTEQLQGKVQYQDGTIDYNLTGKTLGGAFDLEGQVPAEAKPAQPKAEKTKEGRLRLRDIRVGRLLDALGAGTEPEMRGTLNLDIRFKHDAADFFPNGQGTLRLANLQWGDTILAEDIKGDIVLADQEIRLRNLSGAIAQGTVTGQLNYYVRAPERSRFSVNVDAVETGTLLSPWLGKKVEGPIQARFRGKLGKVWSGSGDIELAHGKTYGLEITQWRLPVTWSYSPSQNRGQLEIQETSTQLARGRANAKLTLAWDHSARVEGFVRFDQVELGELLKQVIGKSDLGAGRTTARLEFKGSDVRSLKDLNGTLVASFQQTQALQIPVLQQIAPRLGVGAATTFQNGSLVARLERGSARIQQLTLQGNNIQVYVDGTVSLEERLDLHVIAKNGDVGWPTIRLGPIGVRVPVAGPVPLVLLQEVSAVLSNHVAYLDVTGTPRSPVIRARPLPILSEEAARFFLNRSNLPVTLNP